MITHSCFSILILADDRESTLQYLFAYLRTIQPVKLDIEPSLPIDLSRYAAILATDPANFTPAEQTRLAAFVAAGGGCLGLLTPSKQPLPPIFGVQAGCVGPEAELRLLFTSPDHPVAMRLPGSFYVNSRYHPLKPTADDTETILYADWRYQHSPVVVARTVGDGKAACTTLTAYNNAQCQQLLYRLLRYVGRQPNAGRALGVGLLGYAPSVGQLHGLGAQAVEGLALRAACDLNSRRLAEAKQEFPGLRTYQAPVDLGRDPDVDLVIIATPPNTHAKLAVQMLAAGKHVVCEKPLALTKSETEAMVSMADKHQRHLSCHQNRRWDTDYLAIKQALQDGLIGELFYMETFIGGFVHPCGFWHSHAPVSGGTTYDWGAHYLDWVLSLMPDPATAVIGTRQNRVWHDVTNADQERVQIRFAGGQEAELIHSDIAAIRKPKWYLLGTEGAIIGHWREVTVNEVDPLFYVQTHRIPPTETPPELSLQHRHHSGQMVEQKLALPLREAFPFHRNLADHLLTGEPLAVPVCESAQVVTVLEAAARSAAAGGTVEMLNGRFC